MKIAVMQPYFFPYMGYIELMSKVDVFVVFDDVQYIRRGWINRNRILINNEWIYFTIPVNKAAQKDAINTITTLPGWTDKHLKTFEHVYGKKIKKTPLYEFYGRLKTKQKLLEILLESLQFVAGYYKIKCHFKLSSHMPSTLKRQDRILDICHILGAKEYWNLPGGKNLYDPAEFQKKGITLNFIDSLNISPESCLEKIFTAS